MDVHEVVPLSKAEMESICSTIKNCFDEIRDKYDQRKYPPALLEDYRRVFSSLAEEASVKAALEWKWGYYGKNNYPEKQKALIQRIQDLWEEYSIAARKAPQEPEDTFNFWKSKLSPANTRFISYSFITHLIHPDEVPIIDRFNFTAANSFVKMVRPKYEFKKKPSTWDDIKFLKVFSDLIGKKLGESPTDLDRFLMMYGKYRV